MMLLVPAGSTLDLTRGLSVLGDPAVKKIAIADPSHAPYGQAAVFAMRAEKIYDQVSAKLVTGENISQAASFVLSGAADVGIVALSLGLSAGRQVRFVEIPASDYPPIQQVCVVLKSSKNQDIAAKFETYLRPEEVKKIFERFGFEVPVSAGKSEKPAPRSAEYRLTRAKNQEPRAVCYSQPLVRAIRAASVRLAAPNLLMASDR